MPFSSDVLPSIFYDDLHFVDEAKLARLMVQLILSPISGSAVHGLLFKDWSCCLAENAAVPDGPVNLKCGHLSL